MTGNPIEFSEVATLIIGLIALFVGTRVDLANALVAKAFPALPMFATASQGGS